MEVVRDKASFTSRRTVRGFFYVGLAQATKVVTTLVSTVVISRLLTPNDYGVFAMIMPMMAFFQIFQSFGMNQVMVQVKQLSESELNATFWINFGTSVFISAMMIAISPLAASFYHEPQAGRLCAAMSISFLLSGATIQQVALLNRHLRFGTLSGIDITVNITTVVVTGAAAVVMRNIWALWLGHVTAQALNLALLWIASPWRPGFRTDFTKTDGLLRFGRQVAGASLANYFARNIDTVLIARVWGPDELGLYDRAFKLMMFPLRNISNPIGRLMIPTMSRMVDEPERYRRTAIRATRGLLLCVLPALAVASVSSNDFVQLLLGPRWSGAAPIFFWMSLSGMSQVLMQNTSWLLISSGRGKEYFSWAIASSLTTIASFVLGIPGGAVGVAAAFCISDYFVRLPFTMWWVGRATPVKASDLARIFFPFVANVALLFMVDRTISHDLTSPYRLAIEGFLSYASSCILLCISPAARRDMGALLNTLWACTRTARRA